MNTLFKSGNGKVNGSTLKQYFPALNGEMTFPEIQPYIYQAELSYIIPLIGQAQYDELVTTYNDNTATLTDAQESLLAKVQLPLVHYAVYESAPALNMNITTMGMVQQQNPNVAPSPQWKYNALRVQCIKTADGFADQLLAFMEEHKTDYPLWTASTAYTETLSLFINNAREMTNYVPLVNHSRRTFSIMRNFLQNIVEYKYLVPQLGQALYEELKTQIAAGTLTLANTTIMAFIKPAAAWRTLQEAMPQMMVRVVNGNLYIPSVADGVETFNSSDAQFHNTTIGSIAQQADLTATIYENKLRKYLDDNASDYPLYMNSTAYHLASSVWCAMCQTCLPGCSCQQPENWGNYIPPVPSYRSPYNKKGGGAFFAG